jgi:5-methylcytosine-specific restriction enzyme A
MPQNPCQHWYGSRRWRRRAAWQLREQPLCAVCLTHGLATPAIEADHITRHGGDAYAFWHGPLQSLCRACHQVKSSGEESRKRLGYDKTVGDDGWPIDPNHPANSGKPPLLPTWPPPSLTALF